MQPEEKASVQGGHACWSLVYDVPCPAPWQWGNWCQNWGCFLLDGNYTCTVPPVGTGRRVLLQSMNVLPRCIDAPRGKEECINGFLPCAYGIECPEDCFEDFNHMWWCKGSIGPYIRFALADVLWGDDCYDPS